ncbi:MAG: phosphatidylserine/phosphatidylglycerophosphate/cardiolipin synthase family protein [Minisyncoccia bacterium]
MQYKFFTNSETTWQAMFEAIKLAKESVYLEMYIFQDDMEKFNFSELLKEKAKQGLRVRVILDYFGSSKLSKNALSSMKEAGVEVLFISYLFHRAHRKILVIDNSIGFIGGVNFHQSARLWDDLVVRVKGAFIKKIVKSFAKSYVECGGKDPLILSESKKNFLHKTQIWLVENFPHRNKFFLKRVYKEYLNQTKKHVILATPYFMPKRWFIVLLHQAVLRGVKVDILVPKTTDHALIDRVNYFYMNKLAKLGVNFYLEPKMNHAKVMIIDEKEGIIGSQNLDFLSFELNTELGVFFSDLATVSKLVEITDKWKGESIIFDQKNYKPNMLDYFWAHLFQFFARIL